MVILLKPYQYIWYWWYDKYAVINFQYNKPSTNIYIDSEILNFVFFGIYTSKQIFSV